MQTQITIQHDTVEALKSSPIWAQIMELFLIDQPVSVVEIGIVDTGDESEQD